MQYLELLASHASDICAICTALALLIKPFREKMFNQTAIKIGVQCLLRNVIKDMYYSNRESKTLREYERKTLDSCYEAYKALGGNSFITHLVEEMRTWEII